MPVRYPALSRTIQDAAAAYDPRHGRDQRASPDPQPTRTRMWMLAGVLVPKHPDRPPGAVVVSRPLLRFVAPFGVAGVEAGAVRDARRPRRAALGQWQTAGDLTQAARFKRRRALATLRSLAAGRSTLPLVEVLEPLGIPLVPRPDVAPVPPAVVTIPAAMPVCVASNEQEIVVTVDVRSCIRRLSSSPAGVPPILVVYLAGRLFLNDGHHRLVASRMLGVPIAVEVHGLPTTHGQPRGE
jgi:hypothetical protein